MLIMQNGIAAYTTDEKSYYHHDLVELAKFIPGLSSKNKAILQALTHFTVWAGKYPDPGSRRAKDTDEVFSLAEDHKITAKELFEFAASVMRYTTQIAENGSTNA